MSPILPINQPLTLSSALGFQHNSNSYYHRTGDRAGEGGRERGRNAFQHAGALLILEKFNLPFKCCLGKYRSAVFCRAQSKLFVFPSLCPETSQFVTQLLKQLSLCSLELTRGFGFGLKLSVTLLRSNPRTFISQIILYHVSCTCASMASVQLLAVRTNTQPRLICLPRRHFISHYQHRKLRAFP